MSILEDLLAIIAPHHCLACGREGALLCPWCYLERLESPPARCYRCQKTTSGSALCRVCRPTTALADIWTRTTYDGVASRLVAELKFRYARAAAHEIAVLMADRLPYFPADTVITHTPAVSSHVRQRGFDQAALIAYELAKLRGLPHLTLLGRVGQQRQLGATREQRHAQMHDAFRPLNAALIKGATILIVDDVLTTGSTLEAAASTLKTGGATHVMAATFAQA